MSVAGVVAVALVVAGCGGNARVRHRLRTPPRAATAAAAQRFANRAQQALDGRFTATYRITLFRSQHQVFRGRVFVAAPAGHIFLFRETPAFPLFGLRNYAYEVISAPKRDLINCSQARRNSRWFCESEAGEGAGAMWIQNGAIAPQAFAAGLYSAVAGYTQSATPTTPEALYFSRETVGGRPVRCLSFGNAKGAVGRVCTTASGFIVTYRMSRQFSQAGYATADLVGYSTKVRRGVLQPPATPLVAGA